MDTYQEAEEEESVLEVIDEEEGDEKNMHFILYHSYHSNLW